MIYQIELFSDELSNIGSALLWWGWEGMDGRATFFNVCYMCHPTTRNQYISACVHVFVYIWQLVKNNKLLEYLFRSY